MSYLSGWHETFPLPAMVLDIIGMVGITLLIVVLMWPDSERFLRFVCLVVALIILVLVLNSNGLD